MATAESMSECVPFAHRPPVHFLALSLISEVFLDRAGNVIDLWGWHFAGGTSGFLSSACIYLCRGGPSQYPGSAHLVWERVDDEGQVFPSVLWCLSSEVRQHSCDPELVLTPLSLLLFFPLAY